MDAVNRGTLHVRRVLEIAWSALAKVPFSRCDPERCSKATEFNELIATRVSRVPAPSEKTTYRVRWVVASTDTVVRLQYQEGEALSCPIESASLRTASSFHRMGM